MKRIFPLVVCCVAFACVQVPATPSALPVNHDLAAQFDAAMAAEARDALAADGYLDVIDAAVASFEHPLARAAVAASLDALVSRRVSGLAASGGDHAVAHRSRRGLVVVTDRLRRAWHRAEGAPLIRGFIANSLHHLALRVGAAKAAPKWRWRAGCASPVTVWGPLGFPPLTALDTPSPIPSVGPLPAELPGVPPFATEVTPETVYADACAINVNDVSSLRGTRIVVVDIQNPKRQRLWFGVTSSSAAVAEIGGQPLLERRFDVGGENTTRFGVADVEPGTVRLVLRVAHNQDGQRVGINVLDAAGLPLRTIAPRPEAIASAKVHSAGPVPLLPQSKSVGGPSLAAAALLAVGDPRGASQLLEGAPRTMSSPLLGLLRFRSMEASGLVPRNQMMMRLQSIAERALERCPGCWEARVAAARMAERRKGWSTGVYASFDSLGVGADDFEWTRALGPMELLFVAHQATRGGLGDVARAAYDALARVTPGSLMLADLDWNMFRRVGSDRMKAACAGGTDRSNTRCLRAHVARSDLNGAQFELERLRRLRGSPAILREMEMQQLLAHGRSADALRIYRALPPARRPLALLGVGLDTDDAPRAKQQFEQDMRFARDAPYAYEPLARLLGFTDDDARRFDAEGPELVERDRQHAFLPGAATAILRRIERYDLRMDGVLHFVIYDLRRVSGTLDVASGTWMGRPTVDGRSSTRMLRRRIYKTDGRVLDPDPTARGLQGGTELSQLQAGDYVEALLVGWGLPQDSGQLVVDTPDLLPLRTSVREGVVSLTRPKPLSLQLWAHPLLGRGRTTEGGDRVTVTWGLDDHRPRIFEHGVPPLEARVAISFGTDTWQRIATALADRHKALDDNDPFMGQWVREVIGEEQLPPRRQIARVVAAVGKAIKRSDPHALGSIVASLGGGPQRETARWYIEKESGSRSWVVHRALRELGFDSAIAVSETRPFSATPDFPARAGRFTHPLVRVVLPGGEAMWIDADVNGPPLPPGRVSPELRGRQALLASGEMMSVEVGASADVDQVDVRLSLGHDGHARGTFTVLMHGQPAQQLAQALEVVVGSRRQEMLRNVVLGWLPWADVQHATLASDEGAWQLSLRADITINGYARAESRAEPIVSLPGFAPVHSVFPRPRATTLAARYAAQAERETALAVDQPLLYHVRCRIELPPDTKVVRLPQPLALEGLGLKATRTTTYDAGIVIDDFQLNLPVGAVAAADYPAFARDVRAVDDGFMHATLLELVSKP